MKKITLFTSASITLSITFFIIIYAILSIQYGLKWKQAFNLLSKNPKECVQEYEKIKKFMRHDISFIQNYGSILFYSGELST